MLSRILLAHVEQAIDRDASLAKQIDQAVDTYVDMLLSDRGLTATFASPSLGDRIVVAQRDAVERYAELLVSVVQENAKRDADVAPASLPRAYMLIAGCQQAISINLVSKGGNVTVPTPAPGARHVSVSGAGTAGSWNASPDITVKLVSYEVVPLSDTLAFGLGTFEDTFTGPDGKKLTVPTHASEVFVKKGGKWLVRVDHASFVPPPQPPPPAAPKK